MGIQTEKQYLITFKDLTGKPLFTVPVFAIGDADAERIGKTLLSQVKLSVREEASS